MRGFMIIKYHFALITLLRRAGPSFRFGLNRRLSPFCRLTAVLGVALVVLLNVSARFATRCVRGAFAFRIISVLNA
jgi:hypothetical protein